ncbi:hypothetical protein [Kineosporia sp. R_H_3]|uniref:DUF7482 domain-containing protein n=1 Tax=Kineosporia sp. R_H_3 TaxID=1961848 RepID=UPI000B4AD86B|nr:hypothetical protein [Kineosporia sp. R_H_3]
MSPAARPRLRAVALTAALALTATGLTATVLAGPAAAAGRTVFVPGVTVNADRTATFPLRTGRYADGRTVDYVVIEASTSSAAARYGVGVVNKLANTGRAASQAVTLDRGTIVFSGTVDFSPVHAVAGTPGTGWPPVVATPGSRGDAGYSPIVRLPDGSYLNAPQIGNGTGLHDKVVRIDRAKKTVTLALTDGFARGDAVVYLSTDATAEGPAALEGSTYAPRLNAAPSPGDDSTASARASLAAFVNGPTGSPATRQGINSALLGQGDPLNVLAWTPNQGRYSPLWDVHLTEWAAGTTPERVTRFADVEDLAADHAVSAPGGGAWGPSDVVVNCPIIATA